MFFALIVLEEFPSGVGETAARSLRMPFYANSLGIPGFYSPDLLLFGALGLLLIVCILQKKMPQIPRDTIFWSLVSIGLVILISSLWSIVAANPFSNVYAKASSALYESNERGAALVVLFHMKNFSYLFFSYLLGLLYFQSLQDLNRIKIVWVWAIVASIFIGLLRLANNPLIVSNGYPLFYDSPTSWIFSITVFYWLINWIYGKNTQYETIARSGLSLILVLFVLISFRRTMWGGIALASLCLVPLISFRYRMKYVFLLGIALLSAIPLMIAIPQVLDAVLSRLGSTNVADLSSLYRLALFVWIAENWSKIPFLGYGLKPLWSVEASLGYFRVNLENVHSLYFWVLLRTGVIGCLICGFAFVRGFIHILKIKNSALYEEHGPLLITIILAIVIFMFSGIFNPVYAQIRYVAILGFSLSFISRLPLIRSDRNS